MVKIMQSESAKHVAAPEQVGLAARGRLLEAAAKLFAERGLNGVSIRDLVNEAEVNIAAVNYYFGSKEKLYLEALRLSFRYTREAMPQFQALLTTAKQRGTAEAAVEGIRRYVEEFMRLIFVAGRSSRHAALLTRELNQPTQALDLIVEEFMTPIYEVLQKLIGQARPDLPDAEHNYAALSLLGQCLHYHFCLPINLRLLKQPQMTDSLVSQLSAHIANFSLRGLGLIAT